MIDTFLEHYVMCETLQTTQDTITLSSKTMAENDSEMQKMCSVTPNFIQLEDLKSKTT